MSEEQGKLPENVGSVPELLPTSSANFTSLEQLDVRLRASDSLDEASRWLEIRGEMIRQNEMVKDGQLRRDQAIQDGNHRRSLERTQIILKVSLAVSALVIGTFLIMKGFIEQGLFILGAGLAPDVLKFVLLNRGQRGEDDNT
jgi:hypothetical protein